MIDKDTGEILNEQTLNLIKAPFMRTPYNYDTDAATLEAGLNCQDESRAKQEFKEETDINTIVERFGITGNLPDNLRVPTYGDFDSIHDFQSAMNVVTEAREAFMELPAHIRTRFANDPNMFLEFVHNDENIEEARKLGIANPGRRPETTPAPAASAPAASGAPDTTKQPGGVT